MIKYIIIFALLFVFAKSFHGQDIQAISTDFEGHDKNYNLNLIKNEKKRCGNFESLNLDNMNLHVIKNNIIQSDHIQHISLHNNNLDDIYTILDNVPNLFCLNLSRNEINIYNGHELRHLNLKMLDLSYQKISEAKDLEEQDEETNDIYKYIIFNSTGMKLPNLQYLDLSGNDISTLLWDFNVSFPQLIQLDLINVKADEVEPAFFSKIPKSLRVLHLENNYLHNLTLQNMAEVTALYLDENPILRIIDIASKKLKILSLSNCPSLGHGNFDIPFLEQLDLSMNDFETVSYINFQVFRSLRILLLDYNKLQKIPLISDLQQLNELSLNFNMIKDIPSNIFSYFPSLKKLSLRGNKIEHIEKDSFLGLNNLEYLNLSENELRRLPYNWATSLINLKYLNMNSNQFPNILDLAVNSAVVSLKHLSVKDNIFTKKITTAELAYLPNATTVYVV
ncbi:leucine-rich repeat-containing protein 15-like [Formica exsecta]|uniref:leucine-rich repeat-containing protein 15-like n=1 Tax=Formica exsecta TaxID=72781 RepID=UPI00114351E9|nr:leucine-rich repeat-containing protein 15-like [Formica exsecta]